MKILEINDHYYAKSGADRHYLDLLNLLRGYGHEVAVFAMESSKNEFSPWKKYFVSYAGFQQKNTFIQSIFAVGRLFYSWEAKKKIKKMLDDFHPDVVHIHNINHGLSPSILGEIRKRSIPIVMTVHNFGLICPDHFSKCEGELWKEWNANRCFAYIRNRYFQNSYVKSLAVCAAFLWHRFWNSYDKHIDLYLAPSQFAKTRLIAGGLRREKIMVLPFFIREPDYCEIHKIEIQERFAVYLGKVSKERGVDRLIELFESFPEIKLYLIGEREGDFILPENSNIKQVNALSPIESDRYVKNALFIVSASKLAEMFDFAALEAIKNGKPFVGLRSSALSEIIDNNQNGYLCDSEQEMKEKIALLVRDEGLRILFSRMALEKAKKFKSCDYQRKIIGVFSGITGGENGLDKNPN